MELWEEILLKSLKKEAPGVLASPQANIENVIDSVCYKALKEIKEIVEDDSLDDFNCFSKIEKIVCILEKIGSNGGGRHDF